MLVRITSILTFMVVAVMLALMCLQVPAEAEVELTIRVHVQGDWEFYNVEPYEGIYTGVQFEEIRDQLEKEGRLLQTTTVVRRFRNDHGKSLFSHELIASIKKNDGVPHEYLNYISDSSDFAREYAINCMAESQFQIKASYRLNWLGNEVYFVAMEKTASVHTEKKSYEVY